VIAIGRTPGIAENLTDLVGRTPLLRLNRLTAGLPASVVVKLEAFNPGRSIKDRIGLGIIRDAEQRGHLSRQSVIIEASSGNTGIALAMVCAALGYRLILTMPANVAADHRRLLATYGAEMELTAPSRGMKGAVLKAEALAAELPGAFLIRQFRSGVNVEVHRHTTAEEIWSDAEGEIDILVGGVGTGGTLTGVGELLKLRNAALHVVAVEPYGSPVLSGGAPRVHRIQGIGTGFVPELLNPGIIDEIIGVRDDEAFATARDLARKEGVLAGISSGAALFAALQIARRPQSKGKQIVVVLPDTGERYLSPPLFQEG